jgi:DNA-binding HxlR family transcriptional regulator
MIKALATGKLSWSELLKTTGLSKRTLATQLDELEKQNTVVRSVDRETTNYPPPVYYELTEHARDRYKPLLDLLNYQRALGEIEASIITGPEATVENIVERANLFGGPILSLFLLTLLQYDVKPEQIQTALALWYFPRVEVLTRKTYERLITRKEEATLALLKALKSYGELIEIALGQVREGGKKEAIPRQTPSPHGDPPVQE